MITKEKRSEMVRYWWAKAEESLASARRELQTGSLSFAMNRLYYAAFYAVSALLMESDLSFKKHIPGFVRLSINTLSRQVFLIANGADSMINSSRIDRKRMM